MCRKLRTLEQCRSCYKAVTVDGSVWRVKQRGLFGWSFVQVLRNWAGDPECVEFDTVEEAEAAAKHYARQDYCSQPAAWVEINII